jgi:hypothetical protein
LPRFDLIDRSIIGGDVLFWRALTYFITEFGSDHLHIFLKIFSITFFYLIVRLIFIRSISLFITSIWIGTLGFSLGADWYIRQSIANYFFLFGFLLLLHHLKSNSNGPKNAFRVYFFSCFAWVLSILIHFGLSLLVLLIIFCLLIKNWSFFRLRKNRLFSLLQIIFIGALVFLFFYGALFVVNKFFINLVPQSFAQFGSAYPPQSLIFQIIVMIMNLLYFLNKSKPRGTLTEAKGNHTMFELATIFHYLIFLVMIITVSMGCFYAYTLRIMMFKDIYSVISIGFLIDGSNPDENKRYMTKTKLLLILNFIYLISVSFVFYN